MWLCLAAIGPIREGGKVGQFLRILCLYGVVLGLLASSMLGKGLATNRNIIAFPQGSSYKHQLPCVAVPSSVIRPQPSLQIRTARVVRLRESSKQFCRGTSRIIYPRTLQPAPPLAMRVRRKRNKKPIASQHLKSRIPASSEAAEKRSARIFTHVPYGIPWGTGPPPGPVFAESFCKLPKPSSCTHPVFQSFSQLNSIRSLIPSAPQRLVDIKHNGQPLCYPLSARGGRAQGNTLRQTVFPSSRSLWPPKINQLKIGRNIT